MNPLQHGTINEISANNRLNSWRTVDAAATSARQRADEVLAALKRDCRAAGLSGWLEKKLHPRPTPLVEWEKTARVRVLQAFSVTGKNPFGPELFAADASSVIDLPLSVVKVLGARVEPVAADAVIRHLPAPAGTPQD